MKSYLVHWNLVLQELLLADNHDPDNSITDIFVEPNFPENYSKNY